MKEKKQRMEDALEATRAAVEEGIVPGGGTVLIKTSDALKKLTLDVSDEQTGVEILRKSLLEPIKVIAANSGFEGAVILEKVSSSKAKNFGFDAYQEAYGDMTEMGIVDPAKVTRAAIENAVSVSGMILTTEALITEQPEPPAPPMPGGGMPPGGGMDF